VHLRAGHAVTDRRAGEVPGRAASTLDGAVLVADLSGFPRSPAALGRQAANGIDELAGLLNQVFATCSSARVFPWGRGLVKYAGDSLWPTSPAWSRPRAVAAG
jgi:hypothetical protein